MGDDVHSVFLLAGMVAGYLLLISTVPVRASLRDGFRCLRRYPSIATTLIIFGICYAVFRLAMDVFFYVMLPEGIRPEFYWFDGWTQPEPLGMLQGAALPVVESVAGLFNTSVPTFPMSAFFAMLLLVNYRSSHAQFRKVVRLRFGGWWMLVYPLVLVFALAAVLKPLMYVALPVLAQSGAAGQFLVVASVIDWLSFLFEWLFGTALQVYLICLALVWVRGASVSRAHLYEFTIRRFGYVLKWTGLVLMLGSLLVHVPLLLPYIVPDRVAMGDAVWFVEQVSRWALSLVLLGFSTMQITLTLHNDSLVKAFKDHMAFVRAHWFAIGWFMVVAAVHFFALEILNEWVLGGVGKGSLIGVAWTLIFPVARFAIAGWLLASWVCLYKRCETGFTLLENFIKY